MDQGPEGEARRLQEALARLQADHDEHVTLLEMQVNVFTPSFPQKKSGGGETIIIYRIYLSSPVIE